MATMMAMMAVRQENDEKKCSEKKALTLLHQELVSTHDMMVNTICKHQVEKLACLRIQWSRHLRYRVRSYSTLVVHKLPGMVALAKYREEIHNIRVVQVELVAAPIKAEDKSTSEIPTSTRSHSCPRIRGLRECLSAAQRGRRKGRPVAVWGNDGAMVRCI